jgi:hypothetical protein
VKRVAIVQSNYIPWKGYFDLLRSVDEFILYDDVQYTRRDWRNRNLIKTAQGLKWLTIPVITKGQYLQTIRETAIDGSSWAQRHWKSIEVSYRRAPFFEEVGDWLQPLYLSETQGSLSELNRRFIHAICAYLNIKTRLTSSSDYALIEGRSERLADLCVQAGAREYVSGPAAKAYMNEDAFRMRGVKLTWFNYEGYPKYPQLWGEFAHGVSILDLLFSCGPDAADYMRRINP